MLRSAFFWQTEDLLRWIGELDGAGEGVCVPYHGWHSALDFQKLESRYCLVDLCVCVCVCVCVSVCAHVFVSGLSLS